METKSMIPNLYSKVLVFLSTVIFSFMTFAQDKEGSADVNVTTTTTSTETEWYTNPLYLVIGAVVLIIIIALIARGGGNKS